MSLNQSVKQWILNNLHYFDWTKNENYDERYFKAFVELIYLYLPNIIDDTNFVPDELDIEILKFLDDLCEKFDLEAFVRFDYFLMNALLIIECYKKYRLNIETIILNSQFKLLHLEERIPFRDMDIDATVELINFKENVPPKKLLRLDYERVLLSKEFPLYSLNFMEMYSITHTIFYLTLLGLQNAEKVISKIEVKRISNIIQKLIVITTKNGNYDMFLELLLCIKYLKINVSDEINSIIEYTLTEQEIYYNSNKVIAPLKSLNLSEEGSEEYFFECYHTMLLKMAVCRIWK